jgi:N-acetyl-anhydromuramyl-L-alanine amidase AmpD
MAATAPEIVWIGTNGQNIHVGAGLHPKQALVCHIAEGTLAGCDSWFSNPQAQASANYCVGYDGTIHCYVDPFDDDAPYANGAIHEPDKYFAELHGVNRENPNSWTVSIEHEGTTGQSMPDAQFAASTQLAAWLCQELEIPVSLTRMLGHYQIDSLTREHCPGWSADFWVHWFNTVAHLVSA